MSASKRRPITFIKADDSEQIKRRKRAALYWQERQLARGEAANLDELGRLVRYGPKTQMSDFLNGRKEMGSLTLKSFALTCGVRLDYLNEIDDVMTDELMLQYGGADRIKGISLQIELLKILDYTIDTILEVTTTDREDADFPFTQEEWSYIKPTLTEEALSTPVTALDGTTIPLSKWDGNFENIQERNIGHLRARCTPDRSTTNGYMPYHAAAPNYPGLRYRLVYIISKDSYSFDMRMEKLDAIFRNVTGYLDVEMTTRIRFSDEYQKEQARLLRRPAHGNN